MVLELVWPLLLLYLLTAAMLRRLPVYDLFVEGAKEGLAVTLTVLPNLAAMLTAVHLMDAVGLTAQLSTLCAPLLRFLGLPPELAPLAAVRPLSGSAALGVLENLLEHYGPDSRIGLTASAVMGSGETIFYTVCVYMSRIPDKRTGYAIPCSLAGMLAGLWVCGLFFR
jgi:spore maturation protein B